MKTLLDLGFDNTDLILARRREYSDFIAFISETVPTLPNVATKPTAEVGEMGYSYNGESGIVEEIKGNSITAGGRYGRSDEWSIAPWTQADREAYTAALVARSEANHATKQKAVAAYQVRRGLAKAFTGK